MDHAWNLQVSRLSWIWVILIASSCFLQKTANSDALSGLWIKVWQSAFRAVPSQYTSRVACHLLDLLLRLGLVPYSEVSPSLDAMLQSPELAGPALLCDSSVSFWISVLSIGATERHGSTEGYAERILRWLFKKWTPSKSNIRPSKSWLTRKRFIWWSYLCFNGCNWYPFVRYHSVVSFLLVHLL